MKEYGAIPTVNDGEESSGAPTLSLKRECGAEAIGTAILTTIGCAAYCCATYVGATFVGAGLMGLWQEAAVWSIAGALAVSSAASISGAHLNPAVSLAFALVRPNSFPRSKLVPYWIAQLVGGIIAGLINLSLYGAAIAHYEKTLGLVRGSADSVQSAVGFGNYYSLSTGVSNCFHACWIELFGTAFLTFAIFSATNPANSVVPAAALPLVVGAAIGAAIATLGGLTGAGINPARDFGPRLVTLVAGWGAASMSGAWVYIVGPLLGGPLGALLADKVLF